MSIKLIIKTTDHDKETYWEVRMLKNDRNSVNNTTKNEITKHDLIKASLKLVKTASLFS